jgi:hypothetical protein
MFMIGSEKAFVSCILIENFFALYFESTCAVKFAIITSAC